MSAPALTAPEQGRPQPGQRRPRAEVVPAPLRRRNRPCHTRPYPTRPYACRRARSYPRILHAPSDGSLPAGRRLGGLLAAAAVTFAVVCGLGVLGLIAAAPSGGPGTVEAGQPADGWVSVETVRRVPVPTGD